MDGAANEPDLFEVRTAVVDALRGKQLDRLMSLLADDVARPGDGSASIEEGRENVRQSLAAEFKLAGDPTNPLLAALSFGGSFTTTRGSLRSAEGERQFCAPYFYSNFPTNLPPGPLDLGAEDPWFDSVLIAKNFPLRSGPSDRAPIVKRLSYNLVMVDPLESARDSGGMLWAYITTTDSVSGFVPTSVLRSPFDTSYVCFANRSGAWRVTEFGIGLTRLQ